MITAKFKKAITTGDGSVELDIDLSIEPAQFTALFGASGAGKTTILRMLAGLTDPDQGYIAVNGRVWFDSAKRINLRPGQRSVGFVFQEYNLFPHMTLRENLLFACPRGETPTVIDEFLDIAGLREVQGFKPLKLSGGQKQRAALMRALIRRPEVLLLDEPFSALDLPTRRGLQEEVLKIHQRFQTAVLLVTHDLTDVGRLSKQVFVLHHGLLKREDIVNIAQ